MSQIDNDRTDHSPPWDLIDARENSTPTTPPVDYNIAFTIKNISTKIKGLIADLDKHNPTEKRSASTYILQY
jgi:hypothetical protein